MLNCQVLIEKLPQTKQNICLFENELLNLKTFGSMYFRGKNPFEEDGTQSYLVFQPIQTYFKRIAGVANDNYIYYWKSKGLSDERINYIKISNYGITPYLCYYDTNKIRVKFDGGYLKQDQDTLLYRGIVNIYIVYEVNNNFNVSSYPTLKNCLFGAAELTKNIDIDKYGYSGNGVGKNVIMFGVDMSSSTTIDDRKKDFEVRRYTECRKIIFN